MPPPQHPFVAFLGPRSPKPHLQGVSLRASIWCDVLAPVTKWAALVHTPGEVPEMIRKGRSSWLRTRTSRCRLPGPCRDIEAMAAPEELVALRT